MNRAMKAKADKCRKQLQKEKMERFLMRASHRYYAETLPASSSWFFGRDVVSATKMWWEV